MKTTARRDINNTHVFDKVYRNDPYASYAQLRRDHPVTWDEGVGAWLVSKAADVEAVLKDGKTYSSNRMPVAYERFPEPKYEELFATIGHLMTQHDEPDHRRLRKLTHYAFQRAAVESYAPQIRALAQKLLAPAAARGSMEFMAEFAVPLPILVISKIVGIPAEDGDRVKRYCDRFVSVALSFYAKITREDLDDGAEAIAAFRAYLADRVAVVRETDPNCLLAALADAEEDGERLTFDELVANVILLLTAGNETTTVLLGNGLHRLIHDPAAMRALRGDPGLIANAVEEMLRHEPPAQYIGRVATREVELGGQIIAPGDVVLVLIGSAGRDEDTYDHADTFDVFRAENHHLSFGSGAHMCAGIQLARVEAKIAFETILKSFSDIRPGLTEPVYGPNMVMRGFQSFPILVTGRPGGL